MMKYVWLDVDPGLDDAMAIMLASNSPNIHLLGVSTVRVLIHLRKTRVDTDKTYGNASSEYTSLNAARCLLAFGAAPHVRVYPGAHEPLLRPVKHAPGVHGIDGLKGVKCLPDGNSPDVQALFAKYEDGSRIRTLEGMSNSIKSTWKNGAGHQVTVVSTGPMTNIAHFVSVYPELLVAVEEFVFMGGGIGMGNRSAVAEYNILCDPHAVQMVLNVPVKKTMIPINVTHTAIVTKKIHRELLRPGSSHNVSEELPKAYTNLRQALSTLISLFADSYKSKNGFNDGPPLHDPLTIAYVAHPELFQSSQHRVYVELTGTRNIGETVVDDRSNRARDFEDTWGRDKRNCNVAKSVDVNKFFERFLEATSRCDNISPLNKDVNTLSR